MDDALFVRRLERVGDLPAIASVSAIGIGPRGSRSASVCPSTSSMTRKCRPSGLLHSVERGDVRMIQRRQDFGFALETRDAIGVSGEDVEDDLDCDLAAEPRVARAVDLAHAARASTERIRTAPSRVPARMDMEERIIRARQRNAVIFRGARRTQPAGHATHRLAAAANSYQAGALSRRLGPSRTLARSHTLAGIVERVAERRYWRSYTSVFWYALPWASTPFTTRVTVLPSAATTA